MNPRSDSSPHSELRSFADLIPEVLEGDFVKRDGSTSTEYQLRQRYLVLVDRLEEQLETADAFARVADAYCWDPKTTTHDDLMNARARWQSEVGRAKLRAASSPAIRPDVSEEEGIGDGTPQAARGADSGSSSSETSDPAKIPS